MNLFELGQEISRFINNFIITRTYQVRVGDELLDMKSISGGVPQGTVLFLTLFNIYTAEILTNSRRHSNSLQLKKSKTRRKIPAKNHRRLDKVVIKMVN